MKLAIFHVENNNFTTAMDIAIINQFSANQKNELLDQIDLRF